MVSIQIASDLHIECIDNDDVDPLDFVTPEAPILILAGDIGSFYRQKQSKNFLTKLCIIVFLFNSKSKLFCKSKLFNSF